MDVYREEMHMQPDRIISPEIYKIFKIDAATLHSQL